MTEDVILDVHNLSKTFYLHERKKCVTSVRPISFKAYKEQLTSLVGPSGAGKSSLLKCIFRTYLPTEGKIFYHCANQNRLDLASMEEAHILQLRKNEINFVTQFLHVMPRKSTLTLVAQPLIARGEKADYAQEQAASLLQSLAIPESLWDVSPATFSGGERQRVNIARSLITSSRLLLLDEPTASLDARSRDLVLDLLNRKKEQGTAMLAIFHDPGLIEDMSDHRIEVEIHEEAEQKSWVA